MLYIGDVGYAVLVDLRERKRPAGYQYSRVVYMYVMYHGSLLLGFG
jgi:hypothetical protein